MNSWKIHRIQIAMQKMVLLKDLCNISAQHLYGKQTRSYFSPRKIIPGEPILAVPIQRLERKAC